ncbi:putative short chain type dehydrogenase [Flagelloscypha sp. PMI_526]|nr:putative short chain type dehydrogenase [Flagelloscypha sp. PMI_526]
MPTILIIGAGANIGLATAKRFASAGYKVAIASRTTPVDTTYKHFVFDASQPTLVPKLFEDVSTALGAPDVVLYNAAAPESTDDPLNWSFEGFQSSISVNTSSVFFAAKEAGLKGTFLFTGNKLNVGTLPSWAVFAMGKSAALGYKEKGYKFYYVDERKDNGDAAFGDLSGEAHAEHFLKLVESSEQGPWLQTFVNGKGYKAFNEIHE